MVESEEEEDKKPRGEGGVKKARGGRNGDLVFVGSYSQILYSHISVYLVL